MLSVRLLFSATPSRLTQSDPRALSHEAEQEHATYCAGKFGGLVHTPYGWEAAAHPEPEIRLEDFAPQHKPERAGWLSFMRKRAR